MNVARFGKIAEPERLRGRFEDDLRLLGDLGWEEADEGESFMRACRSFASKRSSGASVIEPRRTSSPVARSSGSLLAVAKRTPTTPRESPPSARRSIATSMYDRLA